MEEIRHNLQSDIIENGISPLTTTTASPDASSTTSDTPTPPNGIHEKNWVSRYQSIGVCEEQRQLLGTEEESSDKHSSDGEVEGDVWCVGKEQHKYYETQFKTLQPDLIGLISGHDARAFFEKSKLPVEDLRKIWQLADITRDGALSLAEFKIAMHLVVLKRNNIQCPETLPQSLVASIPVTLLSPSLSNTGSLSSPQSKGKEWTKFADSPTSTLSSPGPKPVNFDFQRSSIEQNPKILHPVAVRATPVPDPSVEEVKNDLKKITIDSSSNSVPIKPILRPLPKKHKTPGPGAIPPPPQTNSEDLSSASGPTSLPVIAASKKEPPPPPPPRPNKTHFRSSSLDLNKLGKNINPAPSVPPRVSPGANTPSKCTEGQLNNTQFADFSQSSYHGAFHVYKRIEVKQNQEPLTMEKKMSVPEISLEEKNRYLRKVCHELQEELSSLRKERAALEVKLEKLHSRSPVLVHSP